MAHFKKAGFDHPPKMWDELLKQGKVLKKQGNPVGIPISHCSDAHSTYWSVAWSYGAKVLEADGKTPGKAVGGQLGDVVVVHVLGIIDVDGDDLVVAALVVRHGQDADGARPQHAQGSHGLLTQHEDVEGIAVLAVRLRDEAVVRRVVHGAVQDAVNAQEPGVLVQLVLHLRALGDLDDGGEVLLDAIAEGDVVPGVDGHS